jgi:CSLREA domain-containing protein
MLRAKLVRESRGIGRKFFGSAGAGMAILGVLGVAKPASAITVTSADDVVTASLCGLLTFVPHHCSLREAIQRANSTSATDVIRFSIGSGARTINIGTSPLHITQPVRIDGTTQPGFAGQPLIELRGPGLQAGNAGGPIHAFHLDEESHGSEIRGLVINNFSGNAFQVGSSGHWFRGNFIGTNRAGTLPLPNRGGIFIALPSSDNLIGGPNPGDGNVIAGNLGTGVTLLGENNTLLGNLIGELPQGTGAGNAGDGVSIRSSSNTIGLAEPFGGNVISNNEGAGVRVSDGIHNFISGNSIADNDELGIELVGVPANLGQRAPISVAALTQWDISGNPPKFELVTRVSGIVEETVDAGTEVDIYANQSCGSIARLNAKGERFVTSVPTVPAAPSPSGTLRRRFDVTLDALSERFITVTSRRRLGDTSEFSECVEVASLLP